MKISISMVFGTSLLLLVLFAFLGCNSAAYQTKEAETYFAQVVEEVQSSHFEEGVMEELQAQGREDGYEIAFEEDGIDEKQSRYLVTMSYQIKIPFLEWEKEEEISGYAL